jgi:hypothetical protein
VLNELLSSEPRLTLPDSQRQANDRRMAQNEIARMHTLRMMFLSSLVHPPDALEMPPDPEIKPFAMSEHPEPAGEAIAGPIFSVKEIESMGAIATDEDAVVMTSVSRY